LRSKGIRNTDEKRNILLKLKHYFADFKSFGFGITLIAQLDNIENLTTFKDPLIYSDLMVDKLHGGLGEEVDGEGIAESHAQITQHLHTTS